MSSVRKTWRACQRCIKPKIATVIGKQEHRPPAEDQRVAEEEEDDSGQPEEDDADVEERDEVVDPGDELREDARLSGRWMGSEAFEHPACPA